MDNLIKREDALQALVECDSVKGFAYRQMEEAIRAIPTADRPSGEWIKHKERTIVRDNNFIDFFPMEYECSNCGLRRATYAINSSLSLTNFCPNCGADMRKGADDE